MVLEGVGWRRKGGWGAVWRLGLGIFERKVGNRRCLREMLERVEVNT